MIYLVNIVSGNQERVLRVGQVTGILRDAGFPQLSAQETKGLNSLIHDDQIRKTYGMLQGRELMRDIRSRVLSLPRAFDDLSFVRSRSRLGETGETVSELEEIEYRINNTRRRDMKRILEAGGSPLVSRELALYGFCNLSAYIFKMMGKEPLYVCVGRSPTPIAAWLQNHTPNVCMLPFSGARLDDLGDGSIQGSRAQTQTHFDNILSPYLGRSNTIALIDYSTSGESILTMYNMVLDYLIQNGLSKDLTCLSIWRSENTEKAARIGMSRNLEISRERTYKDNSTYFERLKRYLRGDSFIRHIYIEECIESQFDNFFTYTTRWSVEMRKEMFSAMMSLLDNQTFDFLSPYKKSPILDGASPASYMSEGGIKRFERLRSEMMDIEREHRELTRIILDMQPKML